MIDLHARAVADSRKIHNNLMGTGGFAVELAFTSDDTTPLTQTINGFYNDTSLAGVNIETGAPITGNKIAISFSQQDLTIWDGLTSLQRWKVAFTNGAGQDIVAEIMDVPPDRSLGDVLCFCKIISGHKAA